MRQRDRRSSDDVAVLRGRVALVFLLVSCVACNEHVFSPPARPMPLETPATLPVGDFGVHIEGGKHSAIFGPTVSSGTLRIRHGVREDLDFSVECSMVHFDGASERLRTEPSLFLQTMRSGLKYRPRSWFALTGGFGGGWSAGGGFVAPDVGPIIGWENRYIVPFAGLRGGLSVPVVPRSVDLTQTDEAVGSKIGRPRLTWIGSVILGLRMPIGWPKPDQEAGTVRGSLVGGVGFTHLIDPLNKETFIQVAGGAEIVF